MNRRRVVEALILAILAVMPALPILAGGPLALKQSGQPFLWADGGDGIPFHPDRGRLGFLTSANAVALLQGSFDRWEAVDTSTVSYDNGGFLPVDVDISNFGPFLFPSAPDGFSAIVFDEDGSIFNLLFGPGSGVLGFAGPEWVIPATGEIIEGVSFLNGGVLNAGAPASLFQEVMVHEFGHYTNLAHAVVNGEVALFGDATGPTPFQTFPLTGLAGRIETMYPFLLPGGSGGALHPDDIAILSTLYPSDSFHNDTGSISGNIFFANGVTRLRGANVIARNLANPFSDAVSAISGDFAAGNSQIDPFVGLFTLNGLTPGADYAVFIDRIIAGGFSTPPAALPGVEEFWNGPDESSDPCVDFPNRFTPVTATAGVPATGIDIVINPRTLDFDVDGVANHCDNCPSRGNPLQEDLDVDGAGDVCDNCIALSNADQADFDTDGLGDICDDCTDADTDGFGDPGFPTNTCDEDNCPAIANPGQEEIDGDVIGDLCDNCPTTANFPQADADANGAGDACQPIVSILGIQQDGGPVVAVETLIVDPDARPLAGTARLQVTDPPATIGNFLPAFDCSQTVPLAIGDQSFLVFFVVEGRQVVLAATGLGCNNGPFVPFLMAFGACEGNAGPFTDAGLDLAGLAPPVEFCVREQFNAAATQTFIADPFDENSVTLRDPQPRAVLAETPFVDQVIPALDLSTVAPGTRVEVAIEATDGETPPVGDRREFVAAGESLLVFDVNAVPVPAAGGDRAAECVDPAATAVVLDGSGSTDGDADIVRYEWIEDLGRPGETGLGEGPSLGVSLPLRTHRISLRVTDAAGATAVDTVLITVNDTSGPAITLSAGPSMLWPPNHRMVDIDAVVAATDACDSVASLVLEGVTSSEPDDQPGTGDGRTTGDVDGVESGSLDTQFSVRSERAGDGAGRIYTVTYRAVDGLGNLSMQSAELFVPHDLGGVTEPVILQVTETAAGARVDWNPVPGAFRYNLVRGDLRNLREVDGYIDLGPLACLAAGTTATTTVGQEDPELPPLGEAFFYLVEFDDGTMSSFGTVTAARERRAPPGEGCP